MKMLVIGGTGTVGSQVVRELLRRGAQVKVLTRSPEKAAQLPAGAAGVVGDLQSPGTARTVFSGIEGVFLLTALGQSEAHEGLLAVNGARLAGVSRLVAMTLQDPEGAPHIPHFGMKLPIEAAVKGSGIEWTILRPNSFLQNDYWYKDAMFGPGVYPQPFGDVGVSRVDVRDIAEAAAVALTENGHAGQTYNLVGPRSWTGSETAAVWSRALGRPVAYAGNDLEMWEKHMLAVRPDWMVFDIKLMYAHFQQNGWKGTPTDVERLTRVLGHPPRGFEDFAAETAAMWKSA
jgi:uncharacterized protein YbjT (DUF2867 family)